MAQFDVLRNPRRGAYPLLLDLQAELLSRLETRTVAPMVAAKRYGARPITRLNPVVTVDGTDYVVLIQELAAIPRSALGPVVATLASRRVDLIAALDWLFTGA